MAVAGIFALRRDSEWEDVFVRAALALLSGKDIYGSGTNYLYPPFMSLVALPFAFAAPLPGRIAWAAVNALCIVTTAYASWKLAGFSGALKLAGIRHLVAALLAAAGAVPFALNALAHQQVDLLIAALIAAGCLCVVQKREMLGAGLIGLAAAIKGPPLLFAVYFLAGSRFAAAAVVAGVALVVNLLPEFVASSPSGDFWLQAWLERFVIPTQSLQSQLGVWGSAIIYNQSLGGTISRVLPLGGPLQKALTYLLIAGMLAVSAWSFLRRRQPQSPASGDRIAVVAEFSQVICLMLLISPHSSPAHFGILIVPGLVVAQQAARLNSMALWLILAVSAVGGLLINKDLVGAAVYDAALTMGATTWATIALWIGAVHVAASRRGGATAGGH